MDIKFGGVLALGATVTLITVGLTVPVQAAEYNFAMQSGKEGCTSIITESGQEACKKAQEKKNDACKVTVGCDVDKHERTIAKYKEAKERLNSGQVAEADKAKLAETVRNLKNELDGGKESARKGTSLAEQCVAARENVQKWFMEEGIPLTIRTRDDALKQRKELLENLSNTQKKQAAAKSKREADPRDSGAQRDYDGATSEMRDAEKALEQFNNKYGPDIERHASRLIEQYNAEKRKHDEGPLELAKKSVENCKKMDNLSY